MDAKFLGVSKEDLMRFPSEAAQYGFTITPTENSSLDIKHTDKLLISRFLSNHKGKFVLTGIASAGKSTLVNILHTLSGEKVMCLDLVVGIEKIKVCKQFGFANAEQLRNDFAKTVATTGYTDYTSWKKNICLRCINEALDRKALLDLGGFSILDEDVYKLLKSKDVNIILIEEDEKQWLTKIDFLAQTRSDFATIKAKDPNGFLEFCNNKFNKSLVEYTRKADYILHKVDGDYIKTLINLTKLLPCPSNSPAM